MFEKRHSADTAVFWPGQPEPTRGRDAHQAESEAFFRSIENHLENNPYKGDVRLGRLDVHDREVEGKDDRTVARARRQSARRRVRHSRLEFCTVARWKNGEIVEENLFYDQVGFLRADRRAVGSRSPGSSQRGVRACVPIAVQTLVLLYGAYAVVEGAGGCRGDDRTAAGRLLLGDATGRLGEHRRWRYHFPVAWSCMNVPDA